MIDNKNSTITLNNGIEMPRLGFEVFCSRE